MNKLGFKRRMRKQEKHFERRNKIDNIKRFIFNKLFYKRLKRINDKNLIRLWNWYDIGCTDDILSIIDKEFRNRYVNNILHSNVNEFIFYFGDFKTADMWINEPWKLAEFK
ncbi:MAG: hypothetical protein IJV31_08030 [Clostridia bacterium]|nr:hypothetical protein [Clostridia bacterium]